MHNINLTVKIERAISELRRGGKVVISDNNTSISVLLMSSELVQLDTVDTFSKIALSRPNIILSANRSKAIGINNIAYYIKKYVNYWVFFKNKDKLVITFRDKYNIC